MRLFRLFVITFSLLMIGLGGNAQINPSDLNNLETTSEKDLQKLGISKSEVENIKSNFALNSEKEIPKNSSVKKNDNVVNEKQISTKVIIDNDTTSLIYGKDVIKKGFTNIKDGSDRITPPPNYKLGTGDRINITVWGTSEFSNEFTLDNFGNISPSGIGRINLKGKSFEVAKKIIESKFSKFHNPKTTDISIELVFSKIISVNVVGEVFAPGTYSIPSINSAFSILALAGGINELGTIRNIEIIRNGHLIQSLDVYEFLNRPTEFSHTYLQDGDYIVVKPAGGYIEITGEVKRPGKYEIKKDESVLDIFNYMGNFTPLSDKKNINISRITEDSVLFNSFSYTEIKQRKIKLQFGDIININKINSLIYSYVQIEGSINVPGRYQFKKGDKLLDLIENARGLNYNAYTNLAEVIRINSNLKKETITIDLNSVLNKKNSSQNIFLKEFDLVKIFNKNNFLKSRTYTVTGMINKPGEYPFMDNITLKNVITQSNGIQDRADLQMIQIERITFEKNSLNSYLSTINLEYPKDSNFKINEYDNINFRKLPEFYFRETIELEGEVKYPGTYSLNGKNQTLKDLIILAGGLTNFAFTDGASLYRTQDSLGLLAMNLTEVISNENSKFNYIIKPGDSIIIPRSTGVVTITGEFGYSSSSGNKDYINTPYYKGKRANYYIKEYAGGYAKTAKKNKVFAESYSGKVSKTRCFGLRKPKINEGDKIIISKKPPKQKRDQKAPIDYNNLLKNATAQITGILTIVFLVSSLPSN